MTTFIKVGQIYKITYPNGKIYVGQDRTNDINYFGSAHSETIALDFTKKQRKKFSITKEILYEARGTSIQALNKKEQFFIKKYKSYNPSIGYNRSPRGRRKAC